VARFLLISKLTMTRHLLRNVIAIAISFVLLYYGIAWAVLRCSHDAEHSDHAVATEDVDATHKDLHDASLNPVHLDLECVGPDFHTEAMAEASSLPQLDRLTLDVTPHVNNFLTLQTATGDAATDIWLRAVFERSRSLAFLIGLPSYLFLSILRI
jgi:hypothetical protein